VQPGESVRLVTLRKRKIVSSAASLIGGKEAKYDMRENLSEAWPKPCTVGNIRRERRWLGERGSKGLGER